MLRLSIGSCMLRLRLSIGSCMLRLKLSCTGSGPVILTWHAQLHAHSRFLCPTSIMCHHLLNNGERRFTEKVIHVQEMDCMSTAHKRFSQARPTRFCEDLALRAISLRTSLLSGCAALNSKNTSSSIWRFSSDSALQLKAYSSGPSLLRPARRSSRLSSTARRCSRLSSTARRCSRLYSTARGCSRLCSTARRCSRLYGSADTSIYWRPLIEKLFQPAFQFSTVVLL